MNFALLILEFNSPITCKSVGLPLNWQPPPAKPLIDQNKHRHGTSSQRAGRQTRSTFEQGKKLNFCKFYGSLPKFVIRDR